MSIKGINFEIREIPHEKKLEHAQNIVDSLYEHLEKEGFNVIVPSEGGDTEHYMKMISVTMKVLAGMMSGIYAGVFLTCIEQMNSEDDRCIDGDGFAFALSGHADDIEFAAMKALSRFKRATDAQARSEALSRMMADVMSDMFAQKAQRDTTH